MRLDGEPRPVIGSTSQGVHSCCVTPTDDLLRRLKTNDDCLQYLFALRYPSPTCPACGRVSCFYRHRAKQCFTCACGRHHIYPRQRTIFAQSPIPLPVWFDAVCVVIADGERPPLTVLAKKWNVSYATAWRMVDRISFKLRDARGPLGLGEALELIAGSVE